MKSRSDLDVAGGPAADNPYYKVDADRYMIRPQAKLSLFDGRWEQTAGIGYMSQNREYRDEPHASNWFTPDRTKWRGETWKFDYQSVLRPVEWNTILAGVDVTRDSMKTRDPARVPVVFKPASVTATGVFLEDRVTIGEAFSANIGARYEDHSKFGDYLTWKGGAKWKLPTLTALSASIGTGFRAPSLYELHGDNNWTDPNPDLKPEKSIGWDVGFEQPLFCERLVFGARYFRNRIKNMIDYDSSVFPSRYVNVAGRTNTWGIESFATFKVTETLVLSGQHTWTRARNAEDPGDRTVRYRIPLNAVNINLDWLFCDRGSFTAGLSYVGKRWDALYDNSLFATVVKKMPSHVAARAGASWKVAKHLEVFGRVENIFNKKYEDVYGYGTAGIGFFGGATISF
jgi:vitamin B12 transporter